MLPISQTRVTTVVRGAVSPVKWSNPLGGGAGGGICDGEKSHDSAKNNRSSTGPTGSQKRVALLVIRLHRNSRHSEIGAVDCNHGRLSKTSLWVVFLNLGMDRNGRDQNEQDEIDSDGRCGIVVSDLLPTDR